MDTLAHTELLHVISQVSLALIGFLAIVVALRQRSDDAQSAEDMLRLHTFLFPTLIAFFFSFVPELLSLLGLKIYLVWQISNGLIGVVKLGNLISFNRIQARLHQNSDPFCRYSYLVLQSYWRILPPLLDLFRGKSLSTSSGSFGRSCLVFPCL